MTRPNRHIGGFRTSAAGARARHRVLFLSCHLPWPPVSGGRRRELELIRRISRHFDIHLMVVSKTASRDRDNTAHLASWVEDVEIFAAEPPPSRRCGASQILRHCSGEATGRVRELLREGGFDLVHVEGFYLMQHLPGSPGAPVLLVEQNVEYELARQRAVMSGSADAKLDAAATERAERRCWESATLLAAVTEEDASLIRAAAPSRRVRVVPDGADHLPSLRVVDDEPVVAHPGAPLMVLLGNFAYEPNVDAAGFMCGEILPRIHAQVPRAELWLVGHAPPEEVQQLADARVRVTGVVPDVRPYLDIADVIVCPLRIGGGIKVKTIEALRRGKPIVSTSVGAQGLGAACRDSLVIADAPDAFASEVTSLLGDPQARAQLGRRAAAAARDLPTWDEAAAELTRTYEELLYTAPVRARAAGG